MVEQKVWETKTAQHIHKKCLTDLWHNVDPIRQFQRALISSTRTTQIQKQQPGPVPD
jgi:hypothetical protein